MNVFLYQDWRYVKKRANGIFYLFNNFFKRLISFKRVEYVMKNLLNMFSKDAEYISKYAKYVSKRAEYVKYVSNRAESVSNMIKIS